MLFSNDLFNSVTTIALELTEDTFVSLKNCNFKSKQKEIFKIIHFVSLSSACLALRFTYN